ncbi:MAG: hypothetical protein ACI8RZ_003201 [Myxococcota bacterium]|jgi:hypothetical protein
MGDAFSCNGNLSGYGGLPSTYSNPILFGYYGPGSGTVDYLTEFVPDVNDSSLQWSSICPIETLPYAMLGFKKGSDYIYRQDTSGSWYAQYEAFDRNTYDLQPDVTIEYLYAVRQLNPVEWYGRYHPQ